MAQAGPPFRFLSCDDCGLLYLAERLTKEEVARFYGDDYLPHRGEEAWGPFSRLVRMGRERTDRARVARVKELTDLGVGDRVLDIGCGRPTFLRALQESSGVLGMGIDLRADDFADDPGFQRVELRSGDARRVALDGSFTAVTMWHYLEHDYDPVGTLRRLLPHTRSDTLLLIEVPDGRSLARRWA